ncbi:lignostilbene-alpha-beta-dioxygenase isozyme I [Penicillium cf. griseofulvum]|uniref:Lignostilbene-alpha-beta-dioxygenase isozyme I n=1 Tax=Penicillium cf. griseofulvum TaxID=2972120 RepID=A0A9W9IW48_9EURO|nr:lignostilbene-alpha-beta-dioxygenase isozyme I [Penicillium cf. griseofulvum]KAJ5429757.1 lignostilbene-alpha-beta-dioxygenase isozyme I [Penicillium cf. griseofulvum]
MAMGTPDIVSPTACAQSGEPEDSNVLVQDIEVTVPAEARPPICDGECQCTKRAFSEALQKFIFCATTQASEEPNSKNLVGAVGLNAYTSVDLTLGRVEHCFFGPNSLVQEPCFARRSADAPEGDGFLIGLVSRLDTMLMELVVIDTKDFSKPVAVVEIGLQLRQGLHGNWVDASEME